MSAKLIELLLFSGIALFLVNKLFSILGQVEEDDPMRKKRQNSIFGESDEMTEAQPLKDPETVRSNFPQSNQDNIWSENNSAQQLKHDLLKVRNILPEFEPNKFLRGADAAFKMIIEAAQHNDLKALENLLDTRYFETFNSKASNYKNVSVAKSGIKGRISDVYVIGNSATIKVIFESSKSPVFNEEWTFTKSALKNTPNWYLCNIDEVEEEA